MKVVFVASGNKAVGTCSAFVQSQFESLQKEGLDMILFPVVGHGVKGYLKNVSKLRDIIKTEKPDVIHAHYTACGYIATLASMFTKTKVVVSVLGSFPTKSIKLYIVRCFIKHVWNATIVKSNRTKRQLGVDLPVIPNGVNLDKFTLIEKSEARKMCGFSDNEKYIIWCSNPNREEKNFPMAQAAVDALNANLQSDKQVNLFPVFNHTHDEVVEYMCAADGLLLTSMNEGSPNVIKEALACNCPIVSTNVGDVAERISGLAGCYVTEHDPRQQSIQATTQELTELLKKWCDFDGPTQGRERILQDQLTTDQIAERIISVYNKVKC